jgi:hypothetical protein
MRLGDVVSWKIVLFIVTVFKTSDLVKISWLPEVATKHSGTLRFVMNINFKCRSFETSFITGTHELLIRHGKLIL